jgi:peptidoglycan/xylan/chitin deacetylase (PgdA/CDA1 family)
MTTHIDPIARLPNKNAVKRMLMRAATNRWVAPILALSTSGVGTVFMLHRFADPELGNAGHDPAGLRSMLSALRRSGRELLPVEEIVRRAKEDDFGRSAPIAFTVDDGYLDFATVAAPIFAEFECPVTVFLVTGVLDGHEWYWWDRVSFALEETRHRSANISLLGRTLQFAWSSPAERALAGQAIMDALKLVGNTERLRILDLLSSTLEVALPERPPRPFAPMTWEQVRSCAALGTTFGAHTVTHPILSRIGDDEAREEIGTSWRRLTSETTAVTDIFCYPNGGPDDFTPATIRILRELGFSSSVTTSPAYVASDASNATTDAAYRIPRFAYPDDQADMQQILSGIERIKAFLRQ